MRRGRVFSARLQESPAGNETKVEPVKIASYNIRKAVGLDWRRDPERVTDVLLEIDADVVVLQEADRRTGARAGVLPIDRLEGELDYLLPDFSVRALSHGWHGNAILMRARYDSSAVRRIDLPSIDPRGAVSVRITEPELEVIGVHLGLTPGMRRKQVDVLRQVLHDRTHPVILAGDFNEWNLKRLDFGPQAQIVSPGLSFHTARPRAALDLFVLGPGVRAISSHVHRSSLAARASDHLPIVMTVELAKAAT